MAELENNDDVVKVDLSQEPKASSDDVAKVDFREDPTKQQEEPVQEEPAKEEPVAEEPKAEEPVEEQAVEEIVEEQKVEEPVEEKQEEFQALEEITDEEEEQVEEVAKEEPQVEVQQQELPEGIQKLMEFIEDTGGSIEDYVNLNIDLEKFDNLTLLREYYKQTMPHLDSDEVDFMLDDSFSYDEEVDEDSDIRRKKLALKNKVAEAKDYLEGRKSKYYKELKSGSKLTAEQRKAIDFYTNYTKETEELRSVQEKQATVFRNKTDKVFDDKFKGFEFKVGEKRYRYNVKNVSEVKEIQSDINNFVKKFLTKDGMLDDAGHYHKSLFTAMNPDAVASHFYEQGKADALKDSVAKSKNVSMSPRQEHNLTNNTSGPKFKVLGDNSSSFKFKINKK